MQRWVQHTKIQTVAVLYSVDFLLDISLASRQTCMHRNNTTSTTVMSTWQNALSTSFKIASKSATSSSVTEVIGSWALLVLMVKAAFAALIFLGRPLLTAPKIVLLLCFC